MNFYIEADTEEIPLPEKKHKYHDIIEFSKTMDVGKSFVIKGDDAFESGIRRALKRYIENKEFVVKCIDPENSKFRVWRSG